MKILSTLALAAVLFPPMARPHPGPEHVHDGPITAEQMKMLPGLMNGKVPEGPPRLKTGDAARQGFGNKGTASDEGGAKMLREKMTTGSYNQNQPAVWEARVRRVSGEVMARASEEAAWSALKGEMPLYAGDSVKTENGTAEISLDAKGLITVDRNSEFKAVSLGKGETAFTLKFGGMAAKIQHFLDDKLSLQVLTPSAVCVVRGTEFAVEYSRLNKTTVAAVFDEGGVAASPLNAAGEKQGEFPLGKNSELAMAPDQKRFKTVPLSRMGRYRSAIAGMKKRLALMAGTWAPMPAERKEALRARVFGNPGAVGTKIEPAPARKPRRSRAKKKSSGDAGSPLILR